ncbi:hypothetical protein DENSPDRAFT_836971 [Dentipellis sp. KUC8613]|nr:hypothetical protein DENSPDRAFT_836971 [Dentipellis sp. KUC8613]
MTLGLGPRAAASHAIVRARCTALAHLCAATPFHAAALHALTALSLPPRAPALLPCTLSLLPFAPMAPFHTSMKPFHAPASATCPFVPSLHTAPSLSSCTYAHSRQKVCEGMCEEPQS